MSSRLADTDATHPEEGGARVVEGQRAEWSQKEYLGELSRGARCREVHVVERRTWPRGVRCREVHVVETHVLERREARARSGRAVARREKGKSRLLFLFFYWVYV